MRNIRPPQYGHIGEEARRKDRITNPVTKDKHARLRRKWYVVGKNGQPVKKMRASMVRRVQRQHKAYMNSLKTPATYEASKNEKVEKATSRGGSQCHWRSKKEVERANSRTEGGGDHVPQSNHPGKYRILRRAREDMTMMPTPGWSPEPIGLGIILPEGRMPLPLLTNPFGKVPEQVPGLGVSQQDGNTKAMLSEGAMAWLDEILSHMGDKREDLLGPSDFHVNMAYLLSSMFCAELGQPFAMEDDYMAVEPMLAHVNMEATEGGRSSKAELPDASKQPIRVYTDEIVFSRLNSTLANYLKPIYVNAHLEGVSFKRVLIDDGAAVNVLPAKQMKKLGRILEDLIPTDLTVSSFSRAIIRTHGILHLEVDLGSKQIMMAFFVVYCTSTYGALLGRDWIHQSLAIPSTLHQHVAIYHEEGNERPGFWEMVEAESRQFLPTANVAEASFYDPNVGILQCSGADENGRPTKVTAQKLIEQGLFITKEEWDRPCIIPTPEHQ
ncbi:hypothetical protein ACFX2A_036146 [Malus domestica]